MAEAERQSAAERGILNLEWYRSLRGNARHAFWAAFLGWALDAFDFMVLSFSLSAITATFALSSGQAGLIGTVTLVVSALGGVLAGVLADRIGRVKTLMITVAVFSVFTFLSGLAQSYWQLLLFRSLQGLGFGGEWAAGAILLAEVSDPVQRGRVLGVIQSAWAIGWGLAAVAFTAVFSLADPELAWRILFWLGILPALLILYIRARVEEPRIWVETSRARLRRTREAIERGATANPLVQIFRRDLIGTTAAASLLSIGAQGGYYAIFFWLPSFLESERNLEVVGTGSYLAVVIAGSFIGYVTAGYVHDWLGRRPTFALFSVLSAVLIFLYTRMPEGANTLLLFLGFPLGFFASGIFSGFGSFLAELYPSRARGAGQGFCYNFGRAMGAFFPTIIGVLSASIGLAGAIGFGAAAYGLCLIALLLLPETRGKELVALD
ncbi:major facilitator superfamily MFS_1 [Rubrobacter xylanophilus DSM 9941]|uniref:Major facilitator superfamily MFS_1 n=1 Tax=Rubrobacter xylanophilus (strain DSM 9941 / JCM 11954 / NBRC 16129 / PRD-1) TaxID=266117 RepID=Q1ATE2_RUBXD|nr:MFS transporter [Rubrobacter xylanophilus]ABG05336.1 major facilitator superfamily MFS_1 [Rubrobacter xylanophilus DSM 9941]